MQFEYRNFGKRLIKSPKLYFLDTGLLCFLPIVSDFFDGLNDWRTLTRQHKSPAALVYGGDRVLIRQGVCVYPWFML